MSSSSQEAWFPAGGGPKGGQAQDLIDDPADDADFDDENDSEDEDDSEDEYESVEEWL